MSQTVSHYQRVLDEPGTNREATDLSITPISAHEYPIGNEDSSPQDTTQSVNIDKC